VARRPVQRPRADPLVESGVLRRFAVYLLLSVCALAQEIELRPQLRAGDAFELEYVRAREDSRRPQMSGSSRTPVHVRVLEAGPKGFVLDWRQGATAFDNPEIVKNPIAAAAANAVKDMRLEAVLGPDGAFQRLRNEAEVLPKLQSMLDGMLAAFGQQLPDPTQRQTVENLIRRLMSPRTLLSSATHDLQTYFGLHGAKLTKGETVETLIEQPSPLGSGTIPAAFRLTLESMDAHEAKILSATEYDGRALSALTAQLLAQAASGAANTPPPVQPRAVEMSDSGRYVYSRAFGIMSEVVVTRRIVAGDALNRTDGWEIRLVKRPER